MPNLGSPGIRSMICGEVEAKSELEVNVVPQMSWISEAVIYPIRGDGYKLK